MSALLIVGIVVDIALTAIQKDSAWLWISLTIRAYAMVWIPGSPCLCPCIRINFSQVAWSSRLCFTVLVVDLPDHRPHAPNVDEDDRSANMVFAELR